MKVLWLGLEKEFDIQGEVMIMTKDTWDMEKVIAFKPDIVFEREFNADNMAWESEIGLIKSLMPEVKTAVWLIDTHVRLAFHKEYAKNFDYVFMAISHLMPEIDHPNKFWLPLCHTANFVPEFKTERKYELGFIGRFNAPFLEERTKFMEKVKEMYPQFHAVTDYNNLYQNMSDIKVMVNLAYNQDMNFRVFESLACGNTLVTSSVPDLYKIKGLVDRILIFNDYDDLKEKIDLAISSDPTDNQKWIMDHHTMSDRLMSAINMITTNKQEEF